jgi:hypothetical protein
MSIVIPFVHLFNPYYGFKAFNICLYPINRFIDIIDLSDYVGQHPERT